MTEQLENQLSEALGSTVLAVGGVKEFLTSEVPEVLNQALTWYGIYYFVYNIVCLLLIYGSYRLFAYMYHEYKNRRTSIWYEKIYQNEVGLSDTGLFVSIVSFMVATIATVVSIAHLNLIWLKIWIAPKVWILEYIRDSL